MNSQSQPGPAPPEIIDRAVAFLEASLPYVDGDSLNDSDLQRYVLCLFAYGTVHAYVEPSGLSPDAVEAVFKTVMKQLFEWPDDMLDGVAQMMVEATDDEETRELIDAGAEAIAAHENGEEEAVQSLAAILEECDEEDFEAVDDEDEFEDDEDEDEEPAGGPI